MEHYFTNNADLKSEIHPIKYVKDNLSFTFWSDNGVFSKNKIDYGSVFLVETFLKNNNEKIENGLDVGCGYGFIGIYLSRLKNINFDLIDINKRAIHLSMRNIKENNVKATAYLSDIYENVNQKYDLIITNPPIRAGKDVVTKILKEAKEHLRENGSLWFVMRKDHGVKSMIKDLDQVYKLEIMAKSKGFYVVKAKSY